MLILLGVVSLLFGIGLRLLLLLLHLNFGPRNGGWLRYKIGF